MKNPVALAVGLLVAGLLVNRAVDILRNALDKQDRIPKAYWLLAAWGLGVVLAFVACNTAPEVIGLAAGTACVGQVLVGMGFGSVAGFWHEVLSALSSRTTAATPKGLKPRP